MSLQSTNKYELTKSVVRTFVKNFVLRKVYMKLSIIVPAHNEEKTIAQVLEKVLNLGIAPWEKEVVVVNDGSSDGTGDIIDKYCSASIHRPLVSSRVHPKRSLLEDKIASPSDALRFAMTQPMNGYATAVHRQINLGKGAAIKSALEKVTGDYVVIQDADGEYEPSEILNLLSIIFNREHKVAVFGNRGIKSYPERGFHYVIGAKLLTWIFNILYGVRLHDLYTGYKLIPANVFKSLDIRSDGFEFEAEVACKLRKKGCKIIEIPIKNYRPRSKAQGKHIRFKDAIIGMWAIIKYRLK